MKMEKTTTLGIYQERENDMEYIKREKTIWNIPWTQERKGKKRILYMSYTYDIYSTEREKEF